MQKNVSKGAKDLVKFYHLYEDKIFLAQFREIDLSNLSHLKNRISTYLKDLK